MSELIQARQTGKINLFIHQLAKLIDENKQVYVPCDYTMSYKYLRGLKRIDELYQADMMSDRQGKVTGYIFYKQPLTPKPHDTNKTTNQIY